MRSYEGVSYPIVYQKFWLQSVDLNEKSAMNCWPASLAQLHLSRKFIQPFADQFCPAATSAGVRS